MVGRSDDEGVFVETKGLAVGRTAVVEALALGDTEGTEREFVGLALGVANGATIGTADGLTLGFTEGKVEEERGAMEG